MLVSFQRRRGALSLLLLVIIVPLLLVFATGLSIARRIHDEAGLVRAMRQQLAASLAGYDPDLYQQFGVFGVPVESLEMTVFQETVPVRYATVSAELSAATDLFDQDALEQQIARTMKLRLPVLWLDQVFRLTGQPDLSDWLDQVVPGKTPSFGFSNPEQRKGESIFPADVLPADLLSQMPKDLASLLEDLVQESLESVTEEDKLEILEQALDWLGDLSGQSSILAALPDGSGYLSGLSGWLDELSSGPNAPLVHKAGLAEYCLAYLTTAVTVRQEDGKTEPLQTIRGLDLEDLAQTRPAEIERIITGTTDPDTARRQVKTGLTAIRSLIHLAAILDDGAEMALLKSEATALVAILAATTGILLDPESIAYLLALSQAILRGTEDVDDLQSGQAIRLIPPSLLDQPLVMTYADHLRLMLLVLPTDTLLERIGLCIQQTFPQEYAFAIRLCVQPSTGSSLTRSGIALELSYAKD